MNQAISDRIERLRHGNVPEGYKKTRSGIFPIDWTETCLGDIYTERKEPGNENLPLLMVSIHSGVSDGEVDEDDLPKKVKRIEDKSQYKRAAQGDLVFNMMRAWQGAIGTVRTEGMVSPAYIVAEPNDMVDPLFMDYYMKTNRMVQTIHRQSYGVTDFRLRLYWDSFAPIQCVLPSVEEQRKIAEILATQNKVIELKEKLLAEKQRQKKYLLQQLLTGKKRLPGYCGEWEMHPLHLHLHESRIVGSNGAVAKKLTVKLWGKGVIEKKEVHLGSESTIYYRRSAGQFIYSKLDFLNCAFGIIPNELDGYESTQDLPCFDIENINPQFLLYYVTQEQFYERFGAQANGGRKAKRVNPDDLLQYCVAYPPLNEQLAIVKVLSSADKEIDLFYQKLEQEKQKKKALMQLLLTGIVRVEA